MVRRAGSARFREGGWTVSSSVKEEDLSKGAAATAPPTPPPPALTEGVGATSWGEAGSSSSAVFSSSMGLGVVGAELRAEAEGGRLGLVGEGWSSSSSASARETWRWWVGMGVTSEVWGVEERVVGGGEGGGVGEGGEGEGRFAVGGEGGGVGGGVVEGRGGGLG